MSKEILVSGQCPHCHNPLHILDGESDFCPCCDQKVTADELKAGTVGGEELTVASAAQFAMQIENPASGMAYLENRLELMDWDDFETSLSFELEGISTVVEKNKVTNANNPDTWLLEYKSIAEVILHKFNGLKRLTAEIEEAYNPLDLTNTFSSFDRYARLARALIKRRAATYKALESDIRFLKKFNASKENVAKTESEYDDLKKQYEAVALVTKIEDIPEVRKVIEKKQQAIVDALKKDGINAEELYQEALADYNRPSGRAKAFNKFRKLQGYKDSSKYISKINTLSLFNGLVEANGNLYFSEYAQNNPTFNVNGEGNTDKPANSGGSGCSGKGKSAQPESAASEPVNTEYTGKTLSLFNVTNKEYDPKTPIVTGISDTLTSYNGKLFYISYGNTLKSYDFNTGEEKTLDSGRTGCYKSFCYNNKTTSFMFNNDHTAIFLKKRLDTRPVSLDKPGCFKKAQPPKEQLNNFSVLKVDLESGVVKTVIPEVVDVMDFYGELVFFTQSRDVTVTKEGKRGKTTTTTEPKTFFAAYNRETGVIEDMLSERDYLVGAADGKVIYCKYSPSFYNMDLYVYDIATKASTLLEKNVYDAYHLIHDGKVMYTVGCFGRRSMFSINMDGTDRTEIMLNVERIAWFDKNWMYLIKGYGYNTTLVKISYDGKKRVVVATGLKKLLKMTAGNVYYIDNNGWLRIVRNDGKNNRYVIDGCEKAEIIIDSDSIFIKRSETMDKSGKVKISSLYSVDLQGHNIKKVYYGLIDMVEIDEERIFFLQSEKRRYKITTPQEKGDPIVSYINPTVKTYYCFDRQTEEIKPVLVLGVPKEETFEFKSGCFGSKKISAHSEIEEVIEETGYSRAGKMTPGESAEQDKKEAETASTLNPLANVQSAAGLGANKVADGCSGCSGSKK